MTERLAVFDIPPKDAVIVAVLFVVTETVEIENGAVWLPVGTVTLAGTVADASLEVSVTVDGLVAGAFRWTVPPALPPPFTLGASRTTLSMATPGLTVTLAVFETPANAAVIVTFLFEVTASDVTVNVPTVDPAGIEMLEGTAAADGRLPVRVTAVAEDTGAVNRTVPINPFPPATVDWERARLVRRGCSVNVAFFVTPAYVPEIVMFVLAVTGDVVIVKVTDVCCAAIVTLAGTTAAAFPLERTTTAEPAGALPFSVTVPVDVFPYPPTREAGSRAVDVRAALLTVNAAVFVVVPRVPEIVADVLAETPRVVIGKVTVFTPAGTVTEAGTVAAPVFELDSVTTLPPAGAFPDSVTVPEDGFPPTTVAGLREMLERLCAEAGEENGPARRNTNSGKDTSTPGQRQKTKRCDMRDVL